MFEVYLGLIVLVLLILVSVCLWGVVRKGKKKEKGCCGCSNEVEVGCLFPVGVTPAGVDLTCNGRYAYVANNNNYGITGSDSVTVLDVSCCRVLTTIYDESFNEPYSVTVSPDGKRVYVTNSASTTVTVIDPKTNTVLSVIDGFDGPSGLVILPSDPNIAYVNNYGSSAGVGSGNGTTVNVVNLQTLAIVGAPITVGLAPAALAASPCGQFVYTINYVDGLPGNGSMSIIQTSDNTVIGTITGFFGPFGIALTPKGQFAYVTNFGSNNFAPYGTTVSVVDLTLRMITKEIAVGIQPAGIAIKGRYAYVTNYNTLYAGPSFSDLTAGEGTVSVIDTHTNRVLPPTIPVGQSPANIAIRGSTAIVTAYTSNTATALRI